MFEELASGQVRQHLALNLAEHAGQVDSSGARMASHKTDRSPEWRSEKVTRADKVLPERRMQRELRRERAAGQGPPSVVICCVAGVAQAKCDEGDSAMRQLTVFGILLFASAIVYAEGPKPCEELKAEIEKKLEAKGVTSYTLEIVPKDQEAEGKVVGSCEGGTKKIMYRRTTAPSESSSTESTKH
jgi:hypothetical protein